MRLLGKWLVIAASVVALTPRAYAQSSVEESPLVVSGNPVSELTMVPAGASQAAPQPSAQTNAAQANPPKPVSAPAVSAIDVPTMMTKSKVPLMNRPTPPENALRAYIERVRAKSAEETRTPGSLWADSGTLVRLSTDVKAVHLYDVVQILVSESLAASTDGAVKNSRASSANAAITGLFGAVKANNAMQNLLTQTGNSALTAQGQSTTNSSLTTSFGGEVVDVLPNGMLVVEAVRQLTFSQQTQLIKLRGLVRPEDVNASNQIQSSAMTDLELEVTGKGIINDSTYRQNALVRFLQKFVIF